jgi:transglutaminase-like putative cysteine protease
MFHKIINNRGLLLVIFLAIVLMLIAILDANADSRRNYLFTYDTVIKNLPANASVVKVWIPYPVNTPYQDVVPIYLNDKSLAAINVESKYKNQLLYYVIKKPASSEVKLSQSYKIDRYEFSKGKWGDHNQSRGMKNLEKYLKENKFVILNPEIRKIAREITRGKKADVEKARAIYNYVYENMSYDKQAPGWGEGNVERACTIKRGNCTDFHSLFMALAMASKIPAKFVVGFMMPHDSKQRIESYHCWAEFYSKKYGWAPVDVSEARKNKNKRDYYFMNVDSDRVEFSWGRDIVLEPPQKSPSINYFIYPYVEVDGKKFDNVDTSFQFKEINLDRDIQIGELHPINKNKKGG